MKKLICLLLTLIMLGCSHKVYVEQPHHHVWKPDTTKTGQVVEDAGGFFIFNYRCTICGETLRTYKPVVLFYECDCITTKDTVQFMSIPLSTFKSVQ
jgi:hypothetical protein